MGILKKEQVLTDRELLINKENTKACQICIDKLMELESYKTLIVQKRETAIEKAAEIEKQLGELNDKYIVELDEKKLKDIARTKKELRNELEDQRDIASMDYSAVLQKKVDELEEYLDAADAEFNKFGQAVNDRRIEYTNAINEAKKNMGLLQNLRVTHPHNRIVPLTNSILKID